MWKNTAEPDRTQMTIWCLRIACCVAMATDTHSEYVIIKALPLQQWLRERASMLRYTYIASLVTLRLFIKAEKQQTMVGVQVVVA
jgi:hypothetical protein